ncbi:MAG: hypothetical protein IKW86_03355 [Salinivirgaceae bacterium]|nr:hypothetical protein [Salinivirgaceae bacterium]
MKINIKNRIVVFFIILITLYSCAKKEPDVVGVYINKFDTYKHGALHYLVVNKDSTYNHIYILENDTMYIKDKWFIYLSNHWNIVFDNWESMGCEKKNNFFSGENIWRSFMISYGCLIIGEDYPDLSFYRIDSAEIKRLGIVIR